MGENPVAILGWQPCHRAQMQMTGSDWTNCWGEVFRIYRMSGPGNVRVGDVVGIYYPRERKANGWAIKELLVQSPHVQVSAINYA